MKDTFTKYGDFYDLFYTNKNYHRESQYIIQLIASLNPRAKNLVELGSGTGNFSEYFCKAGYDVTGIEKSETMIARSQIKAINNFDPQLADMVSFQLEKKFDVAVSLFDVMCYLTENEQIITCFKTVAAHLNPGGIFIFDGWYTPAVYTSPPVTSIKRAENEQYHITRIAEPVLNYQKNTVDVNYEFIIKNKANHQYDTLNEVHTLRHFNVHEIDYFAQLTGFNLIRAEELLTANSPGKDSWKVCYILQKK
jgi:SAM-dependent methyltransferase